MAFDSRQAGTSLQTTVRSRAPPVQADDAAVSGQHPDGPRSPPEPVGGPPANDPRIDAPRILSQRDVAALIINKMIGTGIFTGPYAVLQSTQSKSVAMGMWGVGFGYTVLRHGNPSVVLLLAFLTVFDSMLMYLEYARKLPFTGGELVYLDDLLPKFRLWAYTLYAFYFIFVYTTCTNAMQFGRQVILASYGKASWADLPNQGADVNLNLLRFIAVAITTATLLLLYISNAKSRLMNKATAGAKILGILIVSGFGIAYLVKHGSYANWAVDDSIAQERRANSSTEWISAFVIVLYSFHGWENATLVAGEIPSFETLKGGFIWAVSIVGSLYLLASGLMCAAFDWKDGPLPNYTAAYLSVGTASERGQVSEAAAVATAVLISLSAIGSMLSVAYTGVRVKQSIGWANILPWSWFWRRTGPLRPKFEWREISGQREVTLVFNQDALTHPGSPEGGLALYWMVTVFYICITAAPGNLDYSIGFAGNLLVYGHFFVEGLVAVGFIWFDPLHEKFQNTEYPAFNWYKSDSDRRPASWMRQVPAEEGQFWSLRRLKHGRLQTLLGVTLLAFSLVIVVTDLWRVEGRVAIGITVGILLAGWAYWWLFIRYESAQRVYKLLGYDLMQQTHGVNDYPNDPTRICHWCVLLGTEHRHPHDSYLSYNQFRVRGDFHPRFLYTIFGDGSEALLTITSWSEFMEALRRCFSSDDADSQNRSVPLGTIEQQ